MTEPEAEADAAPEDEASRDRRALLLVLFLGLVIKLSYLTDYTALPFLDATLFDASVYLRQARAILAGRFGDPTTIAFSPLFGWFGAMLGAKTMPIVFAQLALGMADGALLYRIASRYVAPRVALVAPILFFGYGLVLSYESKLVSESLGLFFVVLATERMTSPAFARGDVRVAAVAGLCVALAVLARASLIFTLPFVPLIALFPLDTPREPLRARGLRTAAVTLGIAAVLTTNGLWNRAHTGLFVPVISVSRSIEQTTARTFDGRLRTAGNETQVSSSWDVVRQAEARIAAHRAGTPDRPMPRIDLLGAITGAPKKLRLALGDNEVTFDYPYYGERTLVRTLGLLPVSFGMIGVIGLAGACVLASRGRARALLPLLPFVLGVLVVTTLYFPSSRYRLAMIVPLLVLAPLAVDFVLRAEGKRRAFSAAALALVVLGFAYKTYAYEVRQPGALEAILAEAYARSGDRTRALEHAQRALALEPDSEEVRNRLQTFGRFAAPYRSGVGRGE